jgi:hypothetical protein
LSAFRIALARTNEHYRDTTSGESSNITGLTCWNGLPWSSPAELISMMEQKVIGPQAKWLSSFVKLVRFLRSTNRTIKGERPSLLVFTEALSAGCPLAARDLPGPRYKHYIGDGV